MINDMEREAPHPDIEAFLILHDPQNAYVFHELSFETPIEWIEYDVQTRQLDFILTAGRVENFGIPVERNIHHYLQNISEICVAQKDGALVLNEYIVPLVVH